MPDVQIVFSKLGQTVSIDLDRPRPQVGVQGIPEDAHETAPAMPEAQPA